MCLETAPFFAPVAFACCLYSGSSVEDLLRAADLLQLARRQPPVGADRGVANSSRIFFESSVVSILGVLEGAATRPRVSSSVSGLFLRPVRQAARPEVVVLVEALLGALDEVVATPLQALLERREGLPAVDLDPLALGTHLVLEVGEVGRRFSASTPVTMDAAK